MLDENMKSSLCQDPSLAKIKNIITDPRKFNFITVLNGVLFFSSDLTEEERTLMNSEVKNLKNCIYNYLGAVNMKKVSNELENNLIFMEEALKLFNAKNVEIKISF